MGFDLAHEPKIFPEIWTGDESRYAPITDQLPLLLMDHCGKGEWYVLNVPEEQNDFDSLHRRVLDGLRRFLASGLPVRLEGPASVSLLEYGNGTFVIESYRNHPIAVRVIGRLAHIESLTRGTVLGGDPVRSAIPIARHTSAPKRYGDELRIEPHSFIGIRECT